MFCCGGPAKPKRLRTPTRAALDTSVPPDKRLHYPYRNAFSGRDTVRKKAGILHGGELGGRVHATDSYWELKVDGNPVDVVSLVEMMIVEGWDVVKKKSIEEPMIPGPRTIESLKDWDGAPLDLSKSDIRENDTSEAFPDYPSDPERFKVMSISELQEWDRQGRPVPENSKNAGSEHIHQYRKLKHPDDPLGLVADKLGRAIANERHDIGEDGTNKKLEPVFVHVYALSHARVLKMLDRGLKLTGSGAYHAVSCLGALPPALTCRSLPRPGV